MNKNWNYNKKVGLEKDNSLGNINTPPDVAKKIVEKFVDLNLVTKSFKFLEPCVGTGSFYFAIVDHLSKKFRIKYILENMVYAYELDQNAIKILKIKVKEKYGVDIKYTKIFQGNFILQNIKEIFDYVITNPPYVASSKLKPDGFETREQMIAKYIQIVDKNINKKSDIYIYFFVKSLNLLKQNGKQIFLCSDSWLDTNFGKVLKNYLVKDYNLDTIVSHRLFSLFRDDTSPVITVISKSDNNKTEVFQLDTEDFNFTDKDMSFSLSKKDFLSKINNDSVNKRNLFILFGKEYLESESFLKENNINLTKLKNLVKIESSSTTFNDLKKKEALLTGIKKDKIFFQIQARINKPPNYKNNIKLDELLYSVNKEVAKDLLDFKENNVYLSTIIDRYPLLFYLKGEKTFHVSKYLSMHFIGKNKNIELMPILINNLVSMYMIEVYLKEGTRKTLRVGEMGFGKELRKNDILELPVLNIDNLKQDSIDKILEHQKVLENIVLYNIEEACENKEYIAIQNIILEDLKINLTFSELKEKVLNFYFRRMRNIKKILKD